MEKYKCQNRDQFIFQYLQVIYESLAKICYIQLRNGQTVVGFFGGFNSDACSFLVYNYWCENKKKFFQEKILKFKNIKFMLVKDIGQQNQIQTLNKLSESQVQQVQSNSKVLIEENNIFQNSLLTNKKQQIEIESNQKNISYQISDDSFYTEYMVYVIKQLANGIIPDQFLKIKQKLESNKRYQSDTQFNSQDNMFFRSNTIESNYLSTSNSQNKNQLQKIQSIKNFSMLNQQNQKQQFSQKVKQYFCLQQDQQELEIQKNSEYILNILKYNQTYKFKFLINKNITFKKQDQNNNIENLQQKIFQTWNNKFKQKESFQQEQNPIQQKIIQNNVNQVFNNQQNYVKKSLKQKNNNKQNFTDKKKQTQKQQQNNKSNLNSKNIQLNNNLNIKEQDQHVQTSISMCNQNFKQQNQQVFQIPIVKGKPFKYHFHNLQNYQNYIAKNNNQIQIEVINFNQNLCCLISQFYEEVLSFC